MDCKEVREMLDLYVDGELSADAAASASVHLNECTPCRRAHQELLRLRRAVKHVVAQHEPPPDLALRIQRYLFSPWRRALAPALVIFLALASLAGLGRISAARMYVAGAMERAAFHLDTPRMLVLEGQLVCRDCELHALYGATNMRELKGHHGALKTAEGKIWNLMESERAEPLIHNASFLGKKVRIHGRLYRRAGCVEVQSYEVL
jgi:hypothetical protein